MDENAGKGPDSGENAENKSAQAAQSAAGETPSDGNNLPVVWSPKLDAADGIADDLLGSSDDEAMSSSADAAQDDPAKPVNEPANDAAPRSLRFALLAASLAAAAALGSFVGSLSATGVAHFWPDGAAKATMADGSASATRAELAEFAALKANLDGASRSANAQFAKLAERLDHIEYAQTEPAAKLTHIIETLDQLEKKSMTASAAAVAAAAPETTGSIAANPPAPAAEAKPPESVLRDWIVQDVRGGRALVENRFGALFDVTAGSILPGLGKVETIKKQDNQWIVVTAHGLIYSAP